MSCYIEKQLLSTTEYYKISADGPYNAIFNGLIWNAKFTAIILAVAIVIWSKIYILLWDQLKKAFRRGEAPTTIRGPHKDEETAAANAGWFDALKKWFVFDTDFLVNTATQSGYEYLTFQRCLIAYQMLLTLVSLGIMLPIHLVVGDRFKQDHFAATTFANLGSDQHYYAYIHVTGAFLLLPFTLATMKMFFRRIGRGAGGEFTLRRTLYLTGMPSNQSRSKSHDVKNYFDLLEKIF